MSSEAPDVVAVAEDKSEIAINNSIKFGWSTPWQLPPLESVQPVCSTLKAFAKEARTYSTSADSLSRQRSSAALADRGDDPKKPEKNFCKKKLLDDNNDEEECEEIEIAEKEDEYTDVVTVASQVDILKQN